MSWKNRTEYNFIYHQRSGSGSIGFVAENRKEADALLAEAVKDKKEWVFTEKNQI